MRVASVTSSLVAIALIATCVAVASSAMAQAPGAVTPITDSSASSSTAAAQNPAPATQAEAPKVPTPVAPVRWSDLESGSTTASGVSVPRVDFFDPRVWDYDYYMNEHPLLRTKFGINTVRKAKEHWLREGIRVGLRGSAKFSAVEYLDRNADVRERFGDGNYPFAIIHYLRRGVHELYRETGGPLRLNIFDARAFDWAWYAANEPLAIAANVGGSEERARAHWRDFGLPAGAMGSVHLNLTAYVDGNADVRAMYGRNYAAALSHWIEVGHLETWRPTGGRACTFWSTWCQRPDGLLFELLSRRPDLPVLNSSDGALSAATLASAPVPVSAGVQVRINGRTCSDLSDMRTLPSGWARAVRATRVMFPGRGATRPCDITVRFATDVQVSTNDQPMPELALTHWDFDDSAPAYVKAEPAGATPDQMMYEGWHWVHKPSEGEVDPNFNGTFTSGSDLSTDLDYVITSWRYEDVGREKIAEEKLPSGHFPRLPVTELWTAVHHYTYRRNAKFYNDFESPEGNRGVAYDDIAQRRPLATRPRIPTHDKNVSVPFAGQLPIELRRHFPAGLPPLHAARPLFVDDVLLGKVSPAEVGIAPSPMQQLLDEFAPYEDFARSLGVNTPSTPDYPTRAPHSPRYNFADSLAKPLPLHWDAWPAGVNNQHLYTPPVIALAANATKA